jgi:Bacterial extracellular solute-binding proteins, family 5 Middle
VLRVGLGEDWLNTTDPAVTRPPSGTGRGQWQLDHAICAELYANQPDAGPTPQPELASGAPHASPDGLTWTIPIRTNFRFSPPLNRAVTPEDVRATLLRALSPELGPAAPAANALQDIVGLTAYRHGITNGASGIALHHETLQITTRRPVRDLPALLALPYFCVLPAGTPATPGGYQDPLPTAGPYYLAYHEGGNLAVLRPNPGYRGRRPPARRDHLPHEHPEPSRGSTGKTRATRLLRQCERRHQSARRLSHQPAGRSGTRSRSTLPAVRRQLTEQPGDEHAPDTPVLAYVDTGGFTGNSRQTHGRTNAGPRSGNGVGPARRQNGTSVLAGQQRTVGPIQKSRADYAALPLPRTWSRLGRRRERRPDNCSSRSAAP